MVDPFEVVRHIRKYDSIPAIGAATCHQPPHGSGMGAKGVFPFLRACQYAQSQGMNVHALYRMLKGRRIPHYKIRGTYFVDPNEIEAWLDACKVKSVAEQICD